MAPRLCAPQAWRSTRARSEGADPPPPLPSNASPLLIEIIDTRLEQVGTSSPQKAGRNDWLG